MLKHRRSRSPFVRERFVCERFVVERFVVEPTASSMSERILEASDARDRWLSSICLRLNQDKIQRIK